MSVRILEGDCLSVMPTIDADSIDAVVCDPPYFLGFMNKGWDAARGKDTKALDCDGLPGTRGHGRLPGESGGIARKNSIASEAVHLSTPTSILRTQPLKRRPAGLPSLDHLKEEQSE